MLLWAYGWCGLKKGHLDVCNDKQYSSTTVRHCCQLSTALDVCDRQRPMVQSTNTHLRFRRRFHWQQQTSHPTGPIPPTTVALRAPAPRPLPAAAVRSQGT